MKSLFGTGKLCNFFLLSYLKVCISVRLEGRNQIVHQDILEQLAACITRSRHYITENSALLYDFSLLEQYFNFFLSQFPNQFFVRYSVIYFDCIFQLPPTKRLCSSLCRGDAKCKVARQFSYFAYTASSLVTKMFIKSENSNHQEKCKTQTQVIIPLLLPHW